MSEENEKSKPEESEENEKSKPEESEENEKSKPEESRKPLENIIYIGTKPPMSYVMATLSSLNNQDSNQLVFKARGRAISRAVDVVEITRRRFMSNKLVVKDIKIGTEQVGEAGDTRNVSTIEITVERTD